MKNLMPLSWVLVAVFCSAAFAQTPPDKEKQLWAVIEVDGGAKVVDAKEVKILRKDLEADYKKRLADWEAEKKAAKKDKRKFEKPKPKKPDLKVLKGGFKTEEAAKAYLEKYLAKKKKKDDSRAR